MSGTRQVKVEILSQAQTGGFTATDSAAEHTEGVLGRVTGGIGRVGSAFGGLAKMAGGFVLAQGILSAPGKLLEMAQAAADDSASVGRLQVAVQNTGVSWDAYKGQLDGVVANGQKLGFSDDETRDGLVTLANETGNTDEAMRRMSSAYDLARGTGMDLHTASKLLGKVTDENRNVFKKYGIDIGDAATAQDVLNVVDQKFQGQAGKYAESDAGKVARLKDAWSELQEQLGYKMLPVLSAVTSFMLDKVLPGASILADKLDGPLHDGFEAVRDAGERIVGLFQGPLSSAFDAVRGHFDLIRRVIGDLLTVARGPLGNAIQGMIQGFGQDGLAGILPGAIEGLRHFGDALRDLGGLALDALGTVDWAGLGQTILSGIGTALGAVSSLATSIDWGAIASQMWTLLGDALSAAESITLDLGGAFVGAVTGTDWSSVAGAVWSNLGAALSAGASLAVDTGSAFLSLVGSVDWPGVASAVWSALGTALSDAANLTVDLGSAFINLVTGVDWPGVASSIWGYLGDAMLTAWDGIVDASQWFGGVIGGVDWTTLASTIWGFLGDQLLTAWSGIVDATTWLGGIFGAVDWAGLGTTIWGFLGDQLLTAWDGIADATTWLGGIFGAVDWAALADLIWSYLNTALTSAAGAAQGLSDAINNINVDTASGSLGTFLALLKPQLEAAARDAATQIGALQQTINDLGETANIVTGGGGGLGKLAEYLGAGGILGSIIVLRTMLDTTTITIKGVDFAVQAFNATLAFLRDLIAKVTWQSISDGLTHAAQSAVDATGMFQRFSDWFTALPGHINEALSGLPGTITGIFSGIATSTEGIVSGMVGSVQGFFSDMAGTVQGTVSGMVGSVQGFISDMVGTVEGAISGMAGSVGGYFDDMWHTATNAAISMYNDVTSTVSNLVTTVVAYVTALPGDAAAAVGDLSSTLTSAGSDLVQGFITGITSRIKDVIDAASSVAHAAIDAITGYGNSPWPVMIASGQDAGVGFAQGLASTAGQVASAAMSLTQAIWASVAAGVQATLPQAALSGDQIAQAMIDGITAKATSIGSAVAQVSDSVALALDKMQQDLIGKIDLARLSGASPEDIAKLQGQLNAVSQVLAGWAAGLGVTVTEAIDQINVSDQLVQQWQTALGNLNNVISGKAKDDLLATITDLNNELAVAVAAGAPQAVIDGLNASLATAQAQLEVVGAEYAAAVKAGVAGGLTPDDVSNAITQATGIDDGSLFKTLQGKLDQLNQAIATAQAEGWSADLIAAMQQQAANLKNQLTNVGAQMSKAAAAGLLSPDAQKAWDEATGKVTQLPLDKLKDLLPKLKDFGVGMVSKIVEGVSGGTVGLQGALDFLNGVVSASLTDMDKTNDLTTKDMIAKLKDLEREYDQQLAQALLDGTDPAGIQANIDAIDALLLKLSSQAQTTAADIKAIADAALAANNAANGIGGPGSGAAAGGGLGLPGTIDQLYGGQFVGGKTAPSYLGTTAPLAVNGGGNTTINIHLTGDQEQTTLSWLFDRFGNLLDAGATLRPSTVGNGL